MVKLPTNNRLPASSAPAEMFGKTHGERSSPLRSSRLIFGSVRWTSHPVACATGPQRHGPVSSLFCDQETANGPLTQKISAWIIRGGRPGPRSSGGGRAPSAPYRRARRQRRDEPAALERRL